MRNGVSYIIDNYIKIGRNMDKLTRAREHINVIDRQMAELFEKRMLCAKEIAEYKMENGLPVFDPSREKIIIENNSKVLMRLTLLYLC